MRSIRATTRGSRHLSTCCSYASGESLLQSSMPGVSSMALFVHLLTPRKPQRPHRTPGRCMSIASAILCASSSFHVKSSTGMWLLLRSETTLGCS